MRWIRWTIPWIGFLVGGYQCATVSTTSDVPSAVVVDKELVRFPKYEGPRSRVQVIRFGIPEEIAQKYSELGDKRVGWGLCHRIVDAFYETGRFEYLEDKEAILKRMVDQWKLSTSGIYAEETVVPVGHLKAPQYLIYAEVFDFGVGRKEQIVGLDKVATYTTRIGVQIRMLDVETGEYIPGSGMGESATVDARGIWSMTREDFDQTTVGEASRRAVNAAVLQLLQRLPKSSP